MAKEPGVGTLAWDRLPSRPTFRGLAEAGQYRFSLDRTQIIL